MLDPIEVNTFPLFKGLNPDTLQFIAQHAFTRDLDAGKELVIEAKITRHIYFLVSGHVRALRISQEGRLQILGRFGPGSTLNIIPMLNDDSVNQASIETLTRVRIIVLDSISFNKLISNYPDFSIMIMKHLAERMTKMVDLVSDLSFHSVRIRLARFLIDMAENPFIEVGWTQDEIAAQIGTIRDVVGRILRDFESKGLIKRNFQQIILLNREGILREAKIN